MPIRPVVIHWIFPFERGEVLGLAIVCNWFSSGSDTFVRYAFESVHRMIHRPPSRMPMDRRPRTSAFPKVDPVELFIGHCMQCMRSNTLIERGGNLGTDI